VLPPCGMLVPPRTGASFRTGRRPWFWRFYLPARNVFSSPVTLPAASVTALFRLIGGIIASARSMSHFFWPTLSVSGQGTIRIPCALICPIRLRKRHAPIERKPFGHHLGWHCCWLVGWPSDAGDWFWHYRGFDSRTRRCFHRGLATATAKHPSRGGDCRLDLQRGHRGDHTAAGPAVGRRWWLGVSTAVGKTLVKCSDGRLRERPNFNPFILWLFNEIIYFVRSPNP
jgi:hypothetical protein